VTPKLPKLYVPREAIPDAEKHGFVVTGRPGYDTVEYISADEARLNTERAVREAVEKSAAEYWRVLTSVRKQRDDAEAAVRELVASQKVTP
jgi:hypothetical protein